jgi:hypothetical protein
VDLPVHIANAEGTHALRLITSGKQQDISATGAFTIWPENAAAGIARLERAIADPRTPADLREKARNWLDVLKRQGNGAAIVVHDAPWQTEAGMADSIREELDHMLQDRIGGASGFRGHLGSPLRLLEHPLAERPVEALLRAGYEPHAPTLAAEIGVRLARTGRYRELDLEPQEARDYAAAYVRELSEGKGRGTADAREFANRIFEALRPLRHTPGE